MIIYKKIRRLYNKYIKDIRDRNRAIRLFCGDNVVLREFFWMKKKMWLYKYAPNIHRSYLKIKKVFNFLIWL